MREKVPQNMIDLVFQLKLPMRLIADGKKAYPVIIKNKDARGGYVIMTNFPQNEVRKDSKWIIELKGRIDVEFVKYCGEVVLYPLKNEPDYYRMDIVEFYKQNMRRFKRVPYRRSIQIISPIETEGILINISASGAMIHSPKELPGNQLTFKIILAKRLLSLTGDILEQKYLESEGIYVVRCHFNPISSKEAKHINNVVKEIILMAKERLK